MKVGAMWNRIISLGLLELVSLFIYRADSSNTSVITTQREHVYVPLLNHGVDVRDVDYIIFYFKGCADVHVGMASEENNFQSKMYVVQIGINWNTISYIKELNEAGTSTNLAQTYGSYLKCDVYRKFHIRWSGEMMKVFASESLVMQGGIGKFPIHYLGISTWRNYMGDWIFEIPESLAAPSSWLSTSDDLQTLYYSVTSPDSYLQNSSIQMTSSDETLNTFSDSYQMTSSEDLHTSFESISSLDTAMSSEGLHTSLNFDSASSAYQIAMTSSEGLQESFDSASAFQMTMTSSEGLIVESISSFATTTSSDIHTSFNSASSAFQTTMTSLESLHTSVESISSLDTTMSSDIHTSFDSASSAFQTGSLENLETSLNSINSISPSDNLTSSEDQHTSFESISSFAMVMSSEGQQPSFDSTSSTYQMTSLENQQTSLTSLFPSGNITSSADLHTSFESISSFAMLMSSEGQQSSFETISSSDTTTSSEGRMQTSSEQMEYLPERANNCKCFCENLFKPKHSVKELITEIQNKLFVSRHNLSATVRRYNSVSDNRPSAVAVGVTGIACLVLTVLVIIMPDIISLILYVKIKFGI